MYKFFYFIFFLSLPYSSPIFAQNKFEKESRIRQQDVPSKALLFIDSLNFKAKIKWYLEEGLTRKSIEAKFKHNNSNYSIEFDTVGMIEDIEIVINWQDLNPGLADSIHSQLKLDCSKHKIEKVQKQFTGNEADLLLLLMTGKEKQVERKFEMIVRCHEQKEVNLFEYLFNEKGIIETKSKIVFKNSSHLEY